VFVPSPAKTSPKKGKTREAYSQVVAKKILKTTTPEEEGDMYHIRFRQPSQFDKIRTPDYADNISDSVKEGTEVRTGKTDAGNWLTQSVLIDGAQVSSVSEAEKAARRIQEKVDD
jgi:hypothetical protein